MARASIAAALLAAVIAACGQGNMPTSSPAPTASSLPETPTLPPLSVSNETTIPVAIAVNGTVVATVAPGAAEDPIAATLPALPWFVEARSPSGRVLSSMTVSAGDEISAISGRGSRADLACGRLDVWSGPPMLGPMFSADPSKPCD